MKLFLRNIVFILILFILIQQLVNNKSYASVNPLDKIERHDRYVFDTRHISLKEMTEASGKIFSGVCRNVKEELDEQSGLRVFVYTFQVNDGIKGVENLKEVTFKQWKATTKEAGYLKGKEYFLFLYPTSIVGLTSPVGFEQGHFNVISDKFNRRIKYVKNGLNNKGLNKSLRSQSWVKVKNNFFLNLYFQNCTENSKPIKYKEFVQIVRYLVEK